MLDGSNPLSVNATQYVLPTLRGCQTPILDSQRKVRLIFSPLKESQSQPQN